MKTRVLEFVEEWFDEESGSITPSTPPNNRSDIFLKFSNKKVKTNEQDTSFGKDKKCLCVPMKSFDYLAFQSKCCKTICGLEIIFKISFKRGNYERGFAYIISKIVIAQNLSNLLLHYSLLNVFSTLKWCQTSI
jgi:hypothetical protein